MATITVSMPDRFDRMKNEIGLFPWVNWSEVAREEVIRKRA